MARSGEVGLPNRSCRRRLGASAFENHSAFGWYPRITEARLRRLLQVDDLAAVADETGRALLRDLPHKRNRMRKDGPLGAIRRYLATQRSRQIWR